MSTEAVRVDPAGPVHLYCRTCWCQVQLHDVTHHVVDPGVFLCEPCRAGGTQEGQIAFGVDIQRVERRTSYDPRDARIAF